MGEVGFVTGVRRFPVKSMGAEISLSQSVTANGLLGDRVAALKLLDHKNLDFLTARQVPDLLQISPQIMQEETDDEPSQIAIEIPEEGLVNFRSTLAINYLNTVVGERWAGNFRPVYVFDRAFDRAPVSLVSVATARAVQEAAKTSFPAQRFRMNFDINFENDIPFYENSLVGRKLHFESGVVLEVVSETERCAMMNYDLNTLERNPDVLRRIIDLNEKCAGVYLRVVKPGTVTVDDALEVE